MQREMMSMRQGRRRIEFGRRREKERQAELMVEMWDGLRDLIDIQSCHVSLEKMSHGRKITATLSLPLFLC